MRRRKRRRSPEEQENQRTCVGDSRDAEHYGRQDEKDHVRPRRMRDPVAPAQGADGVALGGEGPRQGELEDGQGEDDEGLDEVAAAALGAVQGAGAAEADVAGEAAHDGEHGGGEEALDGVAEVHVDVAEAEAGPAAGGRVVGPQQRVGDGVEVGDDDDEHERRGGELAVAPEEAQRDGAGDAGGEGERHAQREVGGEGWRR